MKPFFFFLLFSSILIKATYIDSSSTQNQVFYVDAYSCVFDSFSNNSYCGTWTNAGINVTLNYSENCLLYQEPTRGYCFQANPPKLAYLNESLGIYIYAPAFPKINQNITLWANTSFENFSAWGLQTNCFATFLNTTYNQTINQTIYVNETIHELFIPQMNQNITLDYSSCFVNETFNLSVCAPEANSACGINQQLSWGEFLRNDARKINVTCGIPGTSQEFFFGQNTPQGMYCINYSRTINCTRLYSVQTPNGTQQMCFDTLQDLCTPAEILDVNVRSCFERNFIQLKDELNGTKQSLSQSQILVESYKTGTKLAEQDRLTNTGTLEAVSLIIFATMVCAGAVYLYFTQKKSKELPREPSKMDVN